MNKWAIVALVMGLALGLGACGNSLEKEMLNAVAKELLDPEAAKFRDVRQVGEGVFCGEVNGKNRQGAYVGFERFYASRLDSTKWTVFIDGPNRRAGSMMCAGKD